MIKLIMFDIDGTLKDGYHPIDETTLYAIQECIAKGIKIGVCTGRVLSMVQDDVISLNFHVLVCGDGSQVIVDKKEVFDICLSKKQLKDILESLKGKDIGIALETKQKIYMNKKACFYLQDANQQKGIDHDEKIIYQNNINEFNTDMEVSKICIWSREKIEDFSSVQYVQRKEEDICYYECVSSLAGKGQAMKRVKEILNLSLEEVMCFGDGLNDISMFEECGVSVAMGNAIDELKKVSSSICSSVSNQGIYKELIKRNMIKERL